MNPQVMTEKISAILSDSCERFVCTQNVNRTEILNSVTNVFRNKNEDDVQWLISKFLSLTGMADPVGYAKSLASNKGHDYAGNEDGMSNFKLCSRFGIKPSAGIVTRLSDKISRVFNLLSIGDGSRQVKDESVRDTLIDAANYTAILWLWLTEEELINFESKIGE